MIKWIRTSRFVNKELSLCRVKDALAEYAGKWASVDKAGCTDVASMSTQVTSSRLVTWVKSELARQFGNRSELLGIWS